MKNAPKKPAQNPQEGKTPQEKGDQTQGRNQQSDPRPGNKEDQKSPTGQQRQTGTQGHQRDQRTEKDQTRGDMSNQPGRKNDPADDSYLDEEDDDTLDDSSSEEE